ncbi:hypothetical protein HKD37_18G051333 [Glycine soja]
MLRIASKLSSRFSSSSTALTANPLLPTRLSPIPSSSFRPFTNGLELEANMVVPDAIKMINYALRHWRTDRSLGAYRMGLSVLKICITNELTEGKEPKRENSKGMAMLAMSTLLFERGEYAEAIEKLEGVQELTNSYLGDDLAAVVADKCMKMVENQEKPLEYEERFVDYEAQFVRAKALKGLIELVNGNADSAEDFFDKSLREKYCDGTAGLSYAEFLHKIGNYPMAKEVYRNVVQGAIEVKNAGRPYLGAGNMSVDELIVGSMFALGQLELLMGNYSNAECHLTQALSRAEEAYGDSKHPTVGVALTSIALLYRRKAIQEHSSSLLVQEGLYRKVIDILKVPTMETESEDAAPLVDRSDIAALATGAYAEVLSVQEKRQAEGEKMKNLAESLWKHRWLSLANAIDSDKNIIDSRICRIL